MAAFPGWRTPYCFLRLRPSIGGESGLGKVPAVLNIVQLRWNIFVVAALLFAGVAPAYSQDTSSPANAHSCRSILNDKARLQCEMSNAFGAQSPSQRTALPEGWSLARTSPPGGGPDRISVTHSADLEQSGANFAGVALRCVKGQIELLLIVIEPYPPQTTTIDVAIKMGARFTSTYRAKVIPPGVMIRLPDAVVPRILDNPDHAAELNASLTLGNSPPTAGTIKLAGIGQAIGTLRSLCTTQ